jgi:hypothetical protein
VDECPSGDKGCFAADKAASRPDKYALRDECPSGDETISILFILSIYLFIGASFAPGALPRATDMLPFGQPLFVVSFIIIILHI